MEIIPKVSIIIMNIPPGLYIALFTSFTWRGSRPERNEDRVGEQYLYTADNDTINMLY